MFTFGLAMTLRPGAYEKYKLAHEQLWPAIAEGMRANGVNMAIYRDGDRLFVFASAPTELHWNKSREDPILAAWDKQITQFVEADDKGGIAFRMLPKAFGFGEFR
ncbi:MAG: L-rhamnose mutarotase [Verrucomicrobiota bacterium]